MVSVYVLLRHHVLIFVMQMSNVLIVCNLKCTENHESHILHISCNPGHKVKQYITKVHIDVAFLLSGWRN